MRQIKWNLLKLLMYLLRVFPIKQNKILFCSYRGKSYSCNPKYIAEKIFELDNELDIVWILKNGSALPSGMRYVSRGSIRALYELATARVWVDNARMPLWVRKRKGQYYVQTWHAGISNKPSEKLTEDKLTADYVESAKNDSKMANLFLSNSKWLTDFYRDAFWYNGDILEKGLPREDVLLDNKIVYHEKVCNFFQVPVSTHFVLYAPTFRSNGGIESYDIDYPRLVKTLEDKYGGCWKVLIRLHPNIKEKISVHYDDMCFDGSHYDEINDLILASDMLISDYSSCLFDAMLAGCKVLIYASDIESYSKDRGFFFRWEDLPFPLAENNDDLESQIKNFHEDYFRKSVESFKEKCGFVYNSNASRDVAEHILNVIRSK